MVLSLVLLGGSVFPAAPAATTIVARDFNATTNVSGGMYVINQPGVYVLGVDVKPMIFRSNVAMIQIATSNVTLDLSFALFGAATIAGAEENGYTGSVMPRARNLQQSNWS